MFHFLFKRPLTFLILVFLVTILIGSILLKLPWATHGEISFIDAIFTATSATCVTGLIVKDTGSDFTLFGQIVILLLIQLGGLGIMTAASIIFLFLKKSIGITTGVGLKTILGEEYISDVKSTIKFIILSTFLIEIIGAILIFFRWQGNFLETNKLAFSSLFHSIAAFCNAGFSLFWNNLENFRGDLFTNIIFYFLIIAGGIGFVVLRDFQQKTISFFRKEKTKFTFHSKIVLVTTVLLIFFGAFLFYIFEKNNLTFLSGKELILASFFQSITARTAGFNTVDIGELSTPTLLLLIFLMFFGGAPAGTAGGVKVVSLAIIFFSIISFFKREEEVVIFKRIVPKIQLKNIFILISIYLLFCLVISLSLLYIEKGDFEQILFEIFSAMGTVGLSTGITPYLTDLGKFLIIITMFVGRLLPLSIAIIGSREIFKARILFPEEKIILG